ncbi:MAG: PP2C family protein-serine/threonine phosphatase [Gemmatimonadaceae bacterium]
MLSEAQRKPRDEEIDVYGLTHPGLVRSSNQDHFLICSLHKQVEIRQTSLPDVGELGWSADRVALVAMVADGAGGGVGGEHASRMAVEAATKYVAESTQCYYSSDFDDETFAQALYDAAMRCHWGLLETADVEPELRGMATTLTLWIGVWPRSYLLQVGDSRCYQLRGGELRQISRDQTMAQELVDLGALPRVEAASPRLAHTLSSAIGGPQTAPCVTQFDLQWGDVGLLCSDGLTRHVPHERIRERLLAMRSAREACEGLVQDALDAGGSDNVTVIVGRMDQRGGA